MTRHDRPRRRRRFAGSADHYTAALWRRKERAHFTTYYTPPHGGPSPAAVSQSLGRGWSLGSREQRPEINAKLEPDAKRQKKTHMLHSTMAATAFLVVRIRPTKLSFPNNRMKNAQRRADNNATWCCRVCAYLLTLTVIKRKCNDDWRLTH